MAAVSRAGALVFWLAVLAALLFSLPARLDSLLVLSGLMILAVHLVEVLLAFTLWRERLRPGVEDILPILLYGAFYLRPKLLAAR